MTDTTTATEATTVIVAAPAGAAADAAEKLAIVKTAIGLPDITNNELKFALAYADRLGADLIARQIYVVRTDGKLTFMTSIDYARVVAQRSGQYRGQEPVTYSEALCGCEGYAKVQFPHPEWAEVPVFREGFDAPVSRRTYFHEYVPLERDGSVRYTWQKMPRVMLAKVAEMISLRMAFPNDLGNLYVAEEMDQADSSGPRLSSGVSAADIPEDVAPPFETKFIGTTQKATDGIRTPKAPDYWKGKTDDKGRVDKLEVVLTIGRGKHTAMLMGTPGDPFIADVNALAIQEGERVAVVGKYVEFQWSPDPKKPKQKQIRDVTRLAVLRDNVWHEAGVLEGDSTEVAVPAATEVGPTPGAEPSDSASAPSEPAGPSTPGAEAATAAASTAPDVTAEAAAIFDGMFEDADVDPTRGGSAEIAPADVAKAMELEMWGEADGTDTDMPAVVITVERISTGTREVAALWFKHPDHPVRFQGVMIAAEAEAQGVFDRGPGEIVRVIGGWKRNPVTQADILMLTAVADPA